MSFKRTVHSKTTVGCRLREMAIMHVGALCAATTVGAQCPATWLPENPGIDAAAMRVGAIAPYTNGNIAFGGMFQVQGDPAAQDLALWDGTLCAPLGAGLAGRPGFGSDRVLSMAPALGGGLVVGGNFNEAGGVYAGSIAQWNGSAWSAMQRGFWGGAVRAIAVTPSGDVVAGGDFLDINNPQADGEPIRTHGVAKWDGEAWSPMGGGLAGNIHALTVLSNGDVIAGGQFGVIPGVGPATRIARWNGTVWSAMGSGIQAADSVGVYALATLLNGDVVAAGLFSAAGGVPARNVARWDGQSWSAMGQGIPWFAVRALTVVPNGDLIAATGDRIYRWNGSMWSLSNVRVSGSVHCLAALPDGNVLVGGSYPGFFGRFSLASASPNLTHQPISISACAGQSAVFAVATSDPGVSFQWTKGGIPIDAASNPSAVTEALRLPNVSSQSAGDYACIVSNACWSLTSLAARLSLAICCGPADVGQLGGLFGGDGVLDNNDFVVFIDLFFSGDPRADCGRAGGETGADGLFDNNDFIVFIDQFFEGC